MQPAWQTPWPERTSYFAPTQLGTLGAAPAPTYGTLFTGRYWVGIGLGLLVGSFGSKVFGAERPWVTAASSALIIGVGLWGMNRERQRWLQEYGP